MYKSPMEIMVEQIDEQITKRRDDTIMSTLAEKYNIFVDKDELMRALAYDRQQYEKGYADAKQELQQQWISVDDKLPGKAEYVLANCEVRCYDGYKRHYTCEAFYANQYEVEETTSDDFEYCDYNEEQDRYYLPSGWYEAIHNGEYSCAAIEDFVTHWIPLPKPPVQDE